MRQFLTVEAFYGWASKSPKDEYYNYNSVCGCAWATYLGEMGVQDFSVGGVHWYTGIHDNLVRHEFPGGVGMFTALRDAPHTYGALAKRVKALL